MTTAAGRAVERFVAAYRRFAGNGAGRAPAWLRDLRETGLAHFTAAGFPTTHDEAWRFTSVQPIVETPFAHQPNAASIATVSAQSLAPCLVTDGPRIVFVNGAFAPHLSSTRGLPVGVRLENLAAAIERDPARMHTHLGRYASPEANAFAGLATAFLEDGAFLHLPEGTEVREPIQIVFVAVPSGVDGAPPAVFPRTLVLLERGASAVVVESYVAPLGGTYLTNAVTEIVLGDGARLATCRIQRESETAYHVAVTRSRQGRDAALTSCAAAFGAALARHDIHATLDGPGAVLALNGLSVLRGNQHNDHHTTLEHAQPHGESRELFNGIIDGRARGVFTGRIVVQPGAQRTDSKQTNNNVLLSEDARADSQPQLEIYADDVKCTHGATLGPLDPQALYYLRSRGLDLAAARAMLTYGFGAEILVTIREPAVRAAVERIVRDRLA